MFAHFGRIQHSLVTNTNKSKYCLEQVIVLQNKYPVNKYIIMTQILIAGFFPKKSY